MRFVTLVDPHHPNTFTDCVISFWLTKIWNSLSTVTNDIIVVVQSQWTVVIIKPQKISCNHNVWKTIYIKNVIGQSTMQHPKLLLLKIIGKEFQKIVIRRYLERSIQKKFFSNLHSLQIDYFSRKKLKLRKFTVAVYVIYIYGRDVTGANCECL